MDPILRRIWQSRGILAVLLLPLAGAFALISWLRRWLYRSRILPSKRLPVPVVVVGNITVGGSGKTPLCLWLALRMAQSGRSPGIISRGYGGNLPPGQVREVSATGEALEVGDEPLLLKRRSGLPVFVGSDRVTVAEALLAAYPECDLIISDDGLQHYRLGRDVEIAVLDSRGLMNGWLLPAGPLREPAERLARLDALVINGVAGTQSTAVPVFPMQVVGTSFYALADPSVTCNAESLRQQSLAAVAGIGVPQRFFDHLAALDLKFSEHVFPDHHRYAAEDLAAIAADQLLMTEKDAVKCAGLTDRPIWVLPISAELDSSATGMDLAALVEHRIVEKSHGRSPA